MHKGPHPAGEVDTHLIAWAQGHGDCDGAQLKPEIGRQTPAAVPGHRTERGESAGPRRGGRGGLSTVQLSGVLWWAGCDAHTGPAPSPPSAQRPQAETAPGPGRPCVRASRALCNGVCASDCCPLQQGWQTCGMQGHYSGTNAECMACSF